MKFFITLLKTEFIIYIKDKQLMVLFLSLPILGFSVSYFLPSTSELPALPVGIAISENSEYGNELFNHLEQELGVIEFIPASEDEIRKNVALGTWECGYILDKDFDEKIEKGRYNEIFTLVINEGSSLDSLVSEAVSAAMLTMVADDLAIRYLNHAGLTLPQTYYQVGDQFFLEVIPVANGDFILSSDTSPLTQRITQGILQGFLAIVITVISISLGSKLSQKKEALYFIRMISITGNIPVFLPIFMAEFIFLTALLTLTLFTLGETVGVASLLFIASMTSLTYLVSAFPSGFFSVILPFIPPTMLILTPTIVDISSIYGFIRPISYLFPATHYINSTLGDIKAYFALIILSLIYILCGMTLYKKCKILKR